MIDDEDVTVKDDARESATVLIAAVEDSTKEKMREAESDARTGAIAKSGAADIARIMAGEGDEGDKTTARAAINGIADSQSSVRRDSLRSVFRDTMEEQEKQEKMAQGEFVWETLVEMSVTDVKKSRTTDVSASEAWYIFTFDVSGDTITTTITQDQVFDRKAMWKAFIANSQNLYPERTDNDEEEKWDNFISGVITEVGETVETIVGPRTAGITRLASKVNTSVAFSNLRDAIEEGGVYVDEEPPNHSEIWIPREKVGDTKTTDDVTDRMLQNEISERGMNISDGESVSSTEYVDGRRAVFWRVTPEFVTELVPDDDDDDFTPFAGFREEAEGAGERMDGAVLRAMNSDETVVVGEEDDDE